MVMSQGIPRKKTLTFESIEQQDGLPRKARSDGGEEWSSKLAMKGGGAFPYFWWGMLPPSPKQNADVSPSNGD